jgi:hypothetical protein
MSAETPSIKFTHSTRTVRRAGTEFPVYAEIRKSRNGWTAAYDIVNGAAEFHMDGKVAYLEAFLSELGYVRD